MTNTITDIKAREVLDSRGNPTIEVDVYSDDLFGRFIVPSGASTGQYEAVELRDNNTRFLGKGVKTAIGNVHDKIKPKLVGHDIVDHSNIDQLMIELDGTGNKSELGANAMLGVSIASVKVAAKSQNRHIFQYVGDGTKLPCPMLNVINGGKHAGGNLAIQEFMLMPLGFNSFSEAIRAGSEVYQTLKKVLKQNYGGSAINVGDEGGFAPSIDNTREALDALIDAVEKSGYTTGREFYFGLDAAASEFYEDGKYFIDGNHISASEFVDYYDSILNDYTMLLSLEDPFDENDYESFAELLKRHPSRAIVGDDLTVTNVDRISTAIDKQAMNYLLLKVNQIGTYTEAKAAFDLTKQQNWGVIISHRSGDTEDHFIADLAVGWGAERIKTGAPARSERVAKYNQLLRIEETLGTNGSYSSEI